MKFIGCRPHSAINATQINPINSSRLNWWIDWLLLLIAPFTYRATAWGRVTFISSCRSLIDFIRQLIPSINSLSSSKNFTWIDCLLPPLNSICFFLPFSSLCGALAVPPPITPQRKGKKKQIKFKFRNSGLTRSFNHSSKTLSFFFASFRARSPTIALLIDS